MLIYTLKDKVFKSNYGTFTKMMTTKNYGYYRKSHIQPTINLPVTPIRPSINPFAVNQLITLTNMDTDNPLKIRVLFTSELLDVMQISMKRKISRWMEIQDDYVISNSYNPKYVSEAAITLKKNRSKMI